MTIHHDKSVYGKLAAASEEISADVIDEMNKRLARLQAEEEKSESEKPDKPGGSVSSEE